MTTAERFWAKVNREGPDLGRDLGRCWVWTASLYGRGYGHFYAGDGRYLPAHRYSWELSAGDIPEGIYVLHRCDNRACVRPSHLFLGTQRQNIADAMVKGRMIAPPRLPGKLNPKAKLTPEAVLQVRALAEQGVRQADIGARFGITQGVVSKIVRRVIWEAV